MSHRQNKQLGKTTWTTKIKNMLPAHYYTFKISTKCSTSSAKLGRSQHSQVFLMPLLSSSLLLFSHHNSPQTVPPFIQLLVLSAQSFITTKIIDVGHKSRLAQTIHIILRSREEQIYSINIEHRISCHMVQYQTQNRENSAREKFAVDSCSLGL